MQGQLSVRIKNSWRISVCRQRPAPFASFRIQLAIGEARFRALSTTACHGVWMFQEASALRSAQMLHPANHLRNVSPCTFCFSTRTWGWTWGTTRTWGTWGLNYFKWGFPVVHLQRAHVSNAPDVLLPHGGRYGFRLSGDCPWGRDTAINALSSPDKMHIYRPRREDMLWRLKRESNPKFTGGWVRRFLTTFPCTACVDKVCCNKNMISRVRNISSERRVEHAAALRSLWLTPQSKRYRRERAESQLSILLCYVFEQGIKLSILILRASYDAYDKRHRK